MPRVSGVAALVATVVAALLLVPGCSTLQQLTVLKTVSFEFAGITDVRIAGIRIDDEASVRALTVADATRLGAAVLAGEVPHDAGAGEPLGTDRDDPGLPRSLTCDGHGSESGR